MKKIIFACLFSIKGFLSYSQGSAEENTITVTQINDNQISLLVTNKFNQLNVDYQKVIVAAGIPSFNASDFNFTNLFKSEKTGETEISYSASYIYSDSTIKYSFTVYYKNGIFSKSILVKAATDRSFINYFDLEENRVTDVNRVDGAYTVSNRNINLGGRGGGCGQCVSNCIADAYGNHGWVSVWAFVQSIFIPATGAGIALGCAGSCCL